MLSARKYLRYAACSAGSPFALSVFTVTVLLKPVPDPNDPVTAAIHEHRLARKPYLAGPETKSN